MGSRRSRNRPEASTNGLAWSLLADAVVLAHLAFVVFVLVGGFLAWRFRFAWLIHLPALAWGLWIELSGAICPLTPLENHLRALAGESGYRGGFVEHYLIPVLYPPGLTHSVQYVLSAVLLAVNLFAYGGLLIRPRNGGALGSRRVG